MKALFSRLIGAPIASLVLLTACGGGGGGGSSGGASPEPQVPPPPTAPSVNVFVAELAQNVEPSGARVDVAEREYFAAYSRPGNTWVFDEWIDGVKVGTVTRTTSAAFGDCNLRYTDVSTTLPGEPDSVSYRITSAGLTECDPTGAQGVAPGVYKALSEYVMYPTPFYAQYGTRQTRREGSLQTDLDGDSKPDFYRLLITQTFDAFVPYTAAAAFSPEPEVALFTNTMRATIVFSSDGSEQTITQSVRAEIAPHIGIIGETRTESQQDDTGKLLFTQTTKLELRSVSVNLQPVPGGSQFTRIHGGDGIDTFTRTLALPTKNLIRDDTRNRYYATPIDSATEANRIAIIDPATGRVSYSRVVGNRPNAIALSSDKNSVWVGLDGSSELVELSLPDFNEISRIALPVDGAGLETVAEDFAMSSNRASNQFAVSLSYPNRSPHHAGVILVRDKQLLPARTQAGTGSNRIAFDADRSLILGHSSEDSTAGLRQIAIGSTGVTEQSVEPVPRDPVPFLIWSPEDILVASNRIYFAPSYTRSVVLPNMAGCVKLYSSQLVCVNHDANWISTGTLTRVNTFSGSMQTIGQLRYESASEIGRNPWSERFVPGGTKTLAIKRADSIVLVRHSDLQ